MLLLLLLLLVLSQRRFVEKMLSELLQISKAKQSFTDRCFTKPSYGDGAKMCLGSLKFQLRTIAIFIFTIF